MQLVVKSVTKENAVGSVVCPGCEMTFISLVYFWLNVNTIMLCKEKTWVSIVYMQLNVPNTTIWLHTGVMEFMGNLLLSHQSSSHTNIIGCFVLSNLTFIFETCMCYISFGVFQTVDRNDTSNNSNMLLVDVLFSSCQQSSDFAAVKIIDV